MTMAWTDAATELTRAPTRSTRPRYVPPHLRRNGESAHHSNTSPFGFSMEPTQPGSIFTGSPLGRTGPTRGRGRGQRWGQQRESHYNLNKNRSKNHDPFDIVDKFDRLEVIEEDGAPRDHAINVDAYEDIPVEASGENIPLPVNAFADIDLGEGLTENVKLCKYVKPTPVQRHAIPIAIAGRDLMACAQTGSGKTAAFCFPIISGILRDKFSRVETSRMTRTACPVALIMSPTRELACQIHEEAKKFAHQTGVKIVVAYGGAPIWKQFRNLEKGVDILVATPGRLVDMIERSKVSLRMIKYLAIDEADRMLDMGFEPQIRKIVQQMDMPPVGARQTMLFSATFPDEMQRLASDFLSNYIFLAVGRVGSSTDLIAQKVELVQDIDKRGHLIDLLSARKANGAHGKHALTLVFVETKRGADALEHWLSMNGFPATAIHGDKVQMERERALRSFKSGATPILVATDVASRGLDILNVAHVINFDMPNDIDDYVHRIGRTGRAGKSGLATAFFSDKNMPLAKGLVELMKEAKQEVPSWLNQYAESSSSSSSGRTNRQRGSKFGGYDFRKSSLSGNESFYAGANSLVDFYGGTNSPADSYAAASSAVGYDIPARAGYSDAAHPGYYTTGNFDSDFAATADSYVGGSQGYGFGHQSIVATGWDGWD